MSVKLYRYVGPKRIADRIRPEAVGVSIRSPDDVVAWVRDSGQQLSSGNVIATFVINAAGSLLVADRHSEHVACAGGQPIRAAGEMTFGVGKSVEVVAVSNQSTGYCPEPDSWPAVESALSVAGLTPPDGFTRACEFRKCLRCGTISIIKYGVFECCVCGLDLPTAYNCQLASAE